MGVLLSIDGLPLALTPRDLRALAERHGQVIRCWVVTQPGTNTSLRFGYIEVATDGDAKKIMAALTGEINGKPCTVAIQKTE